MKKQILFLCLSALYMLSYCVAFATDEIRIQSFTGVYNSNCYVVSQNGEGFIVDPGSYDASILPYIGENGIKIHYIFCTHSHIDHVLFASEAKSFTGAMTVLHADDENHRQYYTSERINEWIQNGTIAKEQLPLIDQFVHLKYDSLVYGGEVFTVQNMKIAIIATPGHSKGSICLLVNGRDLFTGDTIYDGSMGNADIDTGNYDDLVKSIKEKILTFNDHCILYQGHGNPCSLKEIRPGLSAIR